jgi:hypothetical protein
MAFASFIFFAVLAFIIAATIPSENKERLLGYDNSKSSLDYLNMVYLAHAESLCWSFLKDDLKEKIVFSGINKLDQKTEKIEEADEVFRLYKVESNKEEIYFKKYFLDWKMWAFGIALLFSSFVLFFNPTIISLLAVFFTIIASSIYFDFITEFNPPGIFYVEKEFYKYPSSRYKITRNQDMLKRQVGKWLNMTASGSEKQFELIVEGFADGCALNRSTVVEACEQNRNFYTHIDNITRDIDGGRRDIAYGSNIELAFLRALYAKNELEHILQDFSNKKAFPADRIKVSSYGSLECPYNANATDERIVRIRAVEIQQEGEDRAVQDEF